MLEYICNAPALPKLTGASNQATHLHAMRRCQGARHHKGAPSLRTSDGIATLSSQCTADSVAGMRAYALQDMSEAYTTSCHSFWQLVEALAPCYLDVGQHPGVIFVRRTCCGLTKACKNWGPLSLVALKLRMLFHRSMSKLQPLALQRAASWPCNPQCCSSSPPGAATVQDGNCGHAGISSHFSVLHAVVAAT